MANENRLEQIKEGAGLEDSRINQEFVDFIRKWSTPALLVLAVLAVGYFLWNKQKEARAARKDEAFEQYSLSVASESPSPDALRRIAEDYKNVEGVSLLAKRAAADEYLRAVRRGVKPGAMLDPQGKAQNPEDILTDADRERFLSEAEALYEEVHAESSDDPALALHTLTALYGLAAVSESRGDIDAARNVLDQAHNLALKHAFVEHAAITQQRIENLQSLATPVTLYHEEQLPEIPALAPPVVETPPEGTPTAEELVGPQPQEPPAEPEGGEQADPGAGGAGETGGDGQAGGGEADAAQQGETGGEQQGGGETGDPGDSGAEDGTTGGGGGGGASDDDGR